MTDELTHVDSRRMIWVAPLTLIASILSVLAVRAVAVRVIHPKPSFIPLTPEPEILDTTIGCIGAIVVFAMIVFSPDSVRTYRWVSTGVLLLSFIPDVALARSHEMGGGWAEALFLMLMHVVVWAVCVTLLPTLSMTAHSETASEPSRRLSIL